MKPFVSNILGSGGKTSSCSGKQRHSRASARKAALIMAEKHREPFEEYRCIHCDYWHVGHPLYWRWTDTQKRKTGVLLRHQGSVQRKSSSRK